MAIPTESYMLRMKIAMNHSVLVKISILRDDAVSEERMQEVIKRQYQARFSDGHTTTTHLCSSVKVESWSSLPTCSITITIISAAKP